MRKWIFGTILFIGLMSSAAAQDMSGLEEAGKRFEAAMQSDDAETIAQLYAEDARILPPGKEIIQGRDAIKAFWTEDLKGVTDVTLTVVDTKQLGDSVREIGQFTVKTAGDNPQELTGKFVTIWRKVGDNWQITDDIWNMNK
jgi:uncharacterized protein (TIGR02246 family)